MLYMKYRRIPIKRLFETSENLDDLEAKLAKNGIEFENKRDLRKFLVWNWKKENKEEIEQAYAAPVEPTEELPYTEYKDGFLNIKIYGIAHGAKGLSPSHKIKRLIQKEYAKQDEQTLWRLEPGMAGQFGLDPADVMGYLDLRILLKSPKFLLLCAGERIPTWPLIRSRLQKTNLGKSIIKAHEEPAHITKLQKILQAHSLPPPFETYTREAAENPLTLYGREMAKSLSRTQEYFFNTQVALVGLSHVQEIVDFLKRETKERETWQRHVLGQAG